jgi:type II secretory pathway component HofQ
MIRKKIVNWILLGIFFAGLGPATAMPTAQTKVVDNAAAITSATKDHLISLNFQDIKVREVLQLLAQFSGFNIITSDTVNGNITLHL